LALKGLHHQLLQFLHHQLLLVLLKLQEFLVQVNIFLYHLHHQHN
tara:strand:- start:388 stop:522 length:135 start_codon:yes stop_codon:yes gene_type:complete